MSGTRSGVLDDGGAPEPETPALDEWDAKINDAQLKLLQILQLRDDDPCNPTLEDAVTRVTAELASLKWTQAQHNAPRSMADVLFYGP